MMQKLKSNKGVSVTVASKTVGQDDKAQTYYYFNWYCSPGKRCGTTRFIEKPIVDIA
jgi:hypothetical protein